MSTTASNTGTWPSRSEAPLPSAAVCNVVDPREARSVMLREAFVSRGMAAPATLDYREVLRDPGCVGDFGPGVVVRIDSPGRAADINAGLLGAGLEAARAIQASRPG